MIDWLLSLGYFWIILILSVVVSLITSIIYKYTTNQAEIKRIKEDIKKLREKMKKHKDNQKKLMEINQEMMSKNFAIMKQSLRSMLYSFLPIILILSWMAGNLVYEPIMPGEEFTVEAFLSDGYAGDKDEVSLSIMPEMEIIGRENDDSKIVWTLRAETVGTYSLLFQGETFRESKEVLVTEIKDYEQPVQSYDSDLERVVVGNDHVRPFGDTSLFGWRPGWLGAYILLSIPLSILMRKFLGVV